MTEECFHWLFTFRFDQLKRFCYFELRPVRRDFSDYLLQPSSMWSVKQGNMAHLGAVWGKKPTFYSGRKCKSKQKLDQKEPWNVLKHQDVLLKRIKKIICKVEKELVTYISRYKIYKLKSHFRENLTREKYTFY